ncbi:MAG: GAF domain-containing protein, partial [Dehalococcoidales bacterium]|nr:GAF domain-containing protein [Dehalococcoidales bacterium]
MTLQRKIVFIILAGLGIGLGAFSWVGIQSVQKSVERTLDERLTMARVLASHLDGTLSYIVNDVQDASFNEDLDSHARFFAAATRLTEALAKSRIIARKIILVAPDGRIKDIEPGDSTSIGRTLSYPALPQTLEKGQPAISGLELGLVTETPVFFASAPVFNAQGKIAGAIVAAIDVKSDNDAFSPSVSTGKTGYVEIIDGAGLILTRTARASPPGILEKSDHPERFAALIKQQKATVGTCHRCHETSAQIERQRDILAFAPLSTASWGVAIRQSEDEALAPTRELEQRFLLLGIIIVISLCFLVWLMMREVVTPIRSLTAAAKRIAAGDFKAGIAVKSDDEIGQLATAFHTMTRELAKSRDELVSRNEELFALNSIVATVSESLNLDEVLSTALSKVLEVTKTTAGHVFLRKPDNELKTEKDIGASPIFQCRQAADPKADCACHQVLRTGQTMLANDSSQCPQLADLTAFFVCIPLKSKSRTLGIINIAGTGERVFTSVDFRLLDSIGYHVGLAIENAMLYEETRQEEELRGKLLGSVISAQEEERKRV